jgi:hypothetical protein
LEEHLTWSLVEAIGVYSQTQVQQVNAALNATTHRPTVRFNRTGIIKGEVNMM